MNRLFVLLIGFLVLASAFRKVCTPEDKKLKGCDKIADFPGCACYTNGTCEQRRCNICHTCQNPKAVSVDYGVCHDGMEKRSIINKDLGN